MSIKKYIYFGPYLEYVPKQIQTVEIKYFCKHCKKNRNHEICGNPKCGQPTIKKEKPIDEDVMTYLETYNHFTEPHCGGEPMDENLLLPCSSEGRPQKFDLDNEQFCGSVPLPTADEINADIRWFMDKHENIMSKMKQLQVQFELKYGFVIHYS